MTTLFRRQCRLTIARPADNYATTPNAIEVTQLRVAFNIEKSLERTPNNAQIAVYNLAPATRANMQDKGLRIILDAGYEDGMQRLFYGDSRKVRHTHEGPNWVTTIEAGDSERAWRWARVNESFRAGSKVSDIVRRLVAASGLAPGNANTVAGTLVGEYANGLVASGPASRELEKVLRPRGYEVSVQDGELQLLPVGEHNTEDIVVLSPTSGLVGNLEFNDGEAKDKKPTVTAKSLLQPSIRPGNRIRLESSSASGLYRAVRVNHTGDTDGSDWYTTVEAEAKS